MNYCFTSPSVAMYHAVMSRPRFTSRTVGVARSLWVLSPEIPTDIGAMTGVVCNSFARLQRHRPPRNVAVQGSHKYLFNPFRFGPGVLRMPQQRVPHPPVRTRAFAALSMGEQ